MNIGFAALGQIIKTGLRADAMTFTPMLRTLCAEKRTSDAVNVVVRRMPELGCTPMSSPTPHFSKGYVLRRNVKRLSI